jgi:hypothetical protein
VGEQFDVDKEGGNSKQVDLDVILEISLSRNLVFW